MPSEKSTFNFNKTHNQILKIKQVTHCLQIIGKNAGVSRMGTSVCVCVCDTRSFILLSIYRLCTKQTESVLALIWRCSDSMIKIFIAIKQICFVRFIDFTHYCVAHSGYKIEENEWVRVKEIRKSEPVGPFFSTHSHPWVTGEAKKNAEIEWICCATNYTKPTSTYCILMLFSCIIWFLAARTRQRI